MACFGSATPVSQIVGRSFPVWLGSGLRIAVAAAVLVPAALVAARRSPEGRSPRPVASTTDRWLLAGLGVVGTFGFSADAARHARGAGHRRRRGDGHHPRGHGHRGGAVPGRPPRRPAWWPWCSPSPAWCS
ncbi:MAG: hypothetical protein R2746_05310 [Acidimicrobiales bacterium]